MPGEPAWKLHFFAARALLGPVYVHTGRRNKTLAQTLSGRAGKFMAGEWEVLWNAVRARSLAARPSRTDAAVATHATQLVRDGLYLKRYAHRRPLQSFIFASIGFSWACTAHSAPRVLKSAHFHCRVAHIQGPSSYAWRPRIRTSVQSQPAAGGQGSAGPARGGA